MVQSQLWEELVQVGGGKWVRQWVLWLVGCAIRALGLTRASFGRSWCRWAGAVGWLRVG